MRVALVHDYLNQMGGAERVLLALHTLFPDAPIYTTIYDPPRMDRAFRAMDIRTSFMQRLPFVKRHHQPFLPLYPFAIEHMDLREYDLVISDSSAFAKGVVTRPDALHICYCHTPMRWAWNFEDYVERERIGRLSRSALAPLIVWLRQWDYTTAARVDAFIANSANVAARIAKYYRREATVLPPPVETSRYTVASAPGQYFLVVSRLIPYKRIDLAVKAFTMLGLPLRIIGTGRDEAALRRLAGPSVQFLGWLPDEEVRAQMAGCRALIFPGEEDFGLAPVEAQACGRPVIAYGAGGALASVDDGVTGLFFHEQTPEALAGAVLRFRDEQFDARVIRQHAEAFDTGQFLERFRRFVAARVMEHPTLSRQMETAAWGTAAAADDAHDAPLDASSAKLADSSSSAGQQQSGTG